MEQAVQPQLQALADQINARMRETGEGVTAVVSVRASAILNLGYDEPVTSEMLAKALAENLCDSVKLATEEASWVDSAKLVELRDE
jgi:Holliday junction resolvasome RuvABC DNA-binding subunit